MKNLLFILTLLLSLTSFSQKSYPRIEKDSLGNKIVIMTYEQAQKVDNSFELLKYFLLLMQKRPHFSF